MRISLTLAAAAVAVSLSGGAALAWGDMYMGDGTHNPNSNTLVHAYPTKHNYCPAGLQPVMMGGVVCCGTPNAGQYVNRAGKVHKHKAPVRRAHKPRAVAVEGVKGVVLR